MQDIILLMQEHPTLTAIFFIVLVLLIGLEFIRQKGSKSLSPAQVTHLINHQNATVIDIRSPDAYASGHIIGAISIPLDSFEKNVKKFEKFKSQPIVLVCATGVDSLRAAKLLQKQGLDAYILTGGLRSWKAEQLPVVK